MNCTRHGMELADEVCDNCGGPYCHECIVDTGGQRFCKTCALARAGVRMAAAIKPVSRRQVKLARRELEAAKAARVPASGGFQLRDYSHLEEPPPPAPAEVAPAGIQWVA